MRKKLRLGILIGLAFFTVIAVVISLPEKTKQKAQQITCVNNMKQIGLSFRMWEGDNGDCFPFNLSTNQGGTLEWCDRDSAGFDRNAWLHLLVMSNELNTPKVLICPQDKSKQAAANWQGLVASNVTYMVRSGTNLNYLTPTNVLAVCPIDGNTVYCDGSVVEGKLIQRGWGR